MLSVDSPLSPLAVASSSPSVVLALGPLSSSLVLLLFPGSSSPSSRLLRPRFKEAVVAERLWAEAWSTPLFRTRDEEEDEGTEGTGAAWTKRTAARTVKTVVIFMMMMCNTWYIYKL
ncbi:hypothetical protein F5H01DRAFT_356540 [Linnemannia elongata]|nr:hypothetical protein F5H01DRAFT_356540 [Linnemannia elongata]